MTKSSTLALTILAMLLGPIGCSTPGVTQYPKPLSSTAQVNPGSVILLIGVRGPDAVNYIQLCHAGIPCMNFRIEPIRDDVVALPVPAGLRKIEFNSFTTAGQGGGYFPIGGAVMQMGYRSVQDPPVDLPTGGVYFLGSIDTSERTPTLVPPSKSEIAKAKHKYGALLGTAEPLNFNWNNEG